VSEGSEGEQLWAGGGRTVDDCESSADVLAHRSGDQACVVALS
jgi:hypothetical protein